MTELLEAARDLRTTLDAEGAKAEAGGTHMTDEAVKLCREAGLYGVLSPREVGGAELSPRILILCQSETLVRSSPTTISPLKCCAAIARHSSYCSG